MLPGSTRGKWVRAALVALSPACLAVSCSLTTPLDGLDDGPERSASDAAPDSPADADAAPDSPAEADAAADSPVEADESGDGAGCSKDCLGGSCVDGACQPVVIVEGQDEPAGITVDDTHLYWVNVATKALKRFPIAGGDQERLDVGADAVNDPFDVAVDGTHLYWSDRGGQEVLRKPLAGGDKEHIVWGVNACAFLAVDDGMLFVTDFQTNNPTEGHIVSTPVAGSDGALIYFSQPTAGGIYASGAELYWAVSNPASVMRGSIDGGSPPATMVSATGTLAGLTYDGSHFYWIEDYARIMRAEVGSGTPELFYQGAGADDLLDIANDGVSIWWSERAAGRIRRLAK